MQGKVPDPNTTELPPTSGGPTARDRGAAARPTVPLAIGPFTLVRLLGAGGMGTVWEATDDAGRRVAVKTVKVADPRLLESIRREIRVLSELVHPGIVRILADGIHDEAPWYAMPLLPGTTLSAHIRAAASTRPVVPGEGDWWTSRLPLPIPSTEVLPRSAAADSPGRDCDPRPAAGGDLASTAFLVRQLCGPLAYMHGEGLVHRDLKPANVLIGPGDVPVIIDFGLMTRFAGARSREDMDALVSGGTAGYVAPEQLRGETVDARADLYALGCLFYELLTGTRPFEGHPSAVIWQHLTVEPAPPSHRAGGVPPEIDDLVMRLLAKDPRNRIGYAEIVDRRLERFTNGAVVAPTRSRPYLYRAGLQGRDEPLALLVARIDRARERRGGFTLVSGESGVGKTRLLVEALRDAAGNSSRPPAAPGPPMLLLDGQCSPGGAWPLEPMQRSLQLLADRCRQRGEGYAAHVLGPRAPILALWEPALASGLDFVETSDAAGLTRSDGASLAASALSETILALATLDPVILAIDDLQWADDLTLDFLRILAGRLEETEAAVALVATCREEEETPVIESLASAPRAARIRLGRLADDGVARMAQEMLALPEPPAALGRFLAERSAGNPLFVAEYLKLAVTEGLLARDDEGRWQVGNAPEMVPATLPVPVTVREVVQRRIAALGADARHVAECAALCDREIEPAVAGAMAALPYERWQDAVAELVRSHVLEDAAAGALRFAHDALREAAQDGIEEHRHRELHRAAARAIESLHAGQGAWMGALGRHHELSGEEERARRCYLEGARYAIDQYAYVEAERLTRSFLALTKAPDPESVQARIALGKTALSRRGVMDAAREELETAVKEARALGEPRLHAAALYALAVVTRDGSAAAARDLFAASLDVARGHGHREEEIEALTALGTLSSEQGRFDDALAFLEEAVVIARAAGLGRAEGVALANRANTLVSLRRDADAEETFDRAIARFGETGDVRARAVLLGNLANLRRLQGRATQARALTEQALALGREIGDRRFEGSMLAFLAYQQSETDVEGALGAYRDAVAISRDVGDRRMEAMEIGNMAGLLSQSGRVDEARDFFARAVALHVGLGSRHHAAGFYADWAAMELLSREDQSIAEGLLEKAEALARELGDALEICKASCVRGHLALACGLDASGDLAASREIAHRIGADVELARRIEVLARTQAAFEAGESLWRGYREEDLTEAQRRWRRDTGNLSTGSSSASQK